jgi:hypothetical protein
MSERDPQTHRPTTVTALEAQKFGRHLSLKRCAIAMNQLSFVPDLVKSLVCSLMVSSAESQLVVRRLDAPVNTVHFLRSGLHVTVRLCRCCLLGRMRGDRPKLNIGMNH